MSVVGLADVCERGGTAVFSSLLRWANGESSDKWDNVARTTETSVQNCKHRIS